MMKLARCFLLLALTLLLAACGAPTRHVFPPDLSVQQLRVTPNGGWILDIRINNYSYDASVRFVRMAATLTVGSDEAGRIDAPIGITIAPSSADVFQTTLAPSTAATKALAALEAKGSGGSLAYKLAGDVNVSDEDGKSPRSFPINHHDYLSPVPGVAHTYR